MDITIVHENDDADIIGPTIKDAIDKLVSILTSIDAEYRDEATIQFESSYETSYVEYYVKYNRHETLEETSRRVLRQHQIEQLRINREREQYEALKAKFGE